MTERKYETKPIEKWNVNDFMQYFGDQHLERFEVEYMPMGSWAAERGLIGNTIGTQKKAGKVDKAVFKRFLDICLDEYKPTRQYPGTSIGFLITYRKNVLQRAEIELRSEERVEAEQMAEVSTDISDWFMS